jgi:hypothetical protein
MSRHEYSDDCPDCRPIVIDPRTGKSVPDDHPVIVAVMKMWNSSNLKQRKAYHAVTCNNSQDPKDIALLETMMMRVGHALEGDSEKVH